MPLAVAIPLPQLPDPRRPERTPSLPAWVALRIASLRTETQPDPVTGKWRSMPTLPTTLLLSEAEREALALHASKIRALCQRTPENDPESEQATLIAETKLMLTLPTMGQNEHSAEARGEAFMMALDDLPTWAVAAAIRRWYRADCGLRENGQPYDYHWCPSPGDLRRIASFELHRIEQQAAVLENLLQAQPRRDFSEEHRRAMRGRMTKLFQSIRTSPVGKDGSGEAVDQSSIASANCGTQPEAQTRP